MSERKISYLDKNYNDYHESLLDISRQYYGDIFNDFNDASIGSWFVDMFSDIADNLSYHIDRTYQETLIDSANQTKSILNIARNMGVKIPGPKCAIVEIEVSCILPLDQENGNQRLADEMYAPYIKRGTLFSTGNIVFELIDDIDFKKQFDNNGISNRQIIANRDSNGNITGYTYKKLGIARSGQSKTYKKIISANDIRPFMSITLNDNDVTDIESIIIKDSKNSTLNDDPYIMDYFVDKEVFTDRDGYTTKRFFEVDNLAEPYRFGIDYLNGDDYYNPTYYSTYLPIKSQENDTIIGYTINESVVKGKWHRLKQKFITEYTDNWKMKIIFGPGLKDINGTIPDNSEEFTKYLMSVMEANDYMGVLPDSNHTMYIRYHVGGGKISNISKGTLNKIVHLKMDIEGVPCIGSEINPLDSKKKNNVINSLRVTNTSPSYGGKDVPSNEELKYYIRYYIGSQKRCVTLKDYESMIMNMPSKYGSPFRISATEENNKVIIYAIGLTPQGKLSNTLSEMVSNNIKEYIEHYRMINDLVEIHPGKIINIGFEVNVFADKSCDKSSVVKSIIEKVYDYMDIRKHMIGEDIFLGDLEKEISKLYGVINLISLKCFNKVGDNYSEDKISQELINYSNTEDALNVDNEINLESSDKILYSDSNSMFEIKFINEDIKVNMKLR